VPEACRRKIDALYAVSLSDRHQHRPEGRERRG
jgi:hypothetical protein